MWGNNFFISGSIPIAKSYDRKILFSHVRFMALGCVFVLLCYFYSIFCFLCFSKIMSLRLFRVFDGKWPSTLLVGHLPYSISSSPMPVEKSHFKLYDLKSSTCVIIINFSLSYFD